MEKYLLPIVDSDNVLNIEWVLRNLRVLYHTPNKTGEESQIGSSPKNNLHIYYIGNW